MPENNEIQGNAAKSHWRYRAFISYSHQDSSWAQWLHRALERYVIPAQTRKEIQVELPASGRITPIFLDKAELAATGDLDLAVRAALDESQALIVIASPAAAQSLKVRQEIIAFKMIKPQRPVLTLIVAGRPSTVARGLPADQECFPAPLRLAVNSAGELTGDDAEPLAADVRDGRPRRPATLRLIAGILGINFDALARREAQRRTRRLAIGAALAVCGMLAASALALVAWIERNDADRQRTRAESEARASRATADFLSAVFEAPTPEKSLGRPVSARDLLDLGAKRLQSELDRTPAIKWRLMVNIGRAYRLIGAFDRAQPLLEDAVAAYDKQALSGDRDQVDALGELGNLYSDMARPQDAVRFLARAVTLEARLRPEQRTVRPRLSLGRVEIQLNQDADALADLDAAAEFLRTQPAETRDNVDLLLRYGMLYNSQGGYKKAIEYDDQALALARRLFGPESPAALLALGELAHNYNSAGDLKTAETYYGQEVSISESIYGPEHPTVSTILMNYAINKAEQGDTRAAEPLFRRVLAIREKVFGQNNINTAYALDNLGELLIDTGRFDEALSLLQRSEGIYQRVEGPKHPDVAFALNSQSSVLLKLKRPVEARAQAVRALVINEEAHGDRHPLVARSLYHIAEADLAEHNYPQAVSELERGVGIADLTWHDSYFQMQPFLEDYAKALKGVQRKEEAAAVLKRLALLRAADALKK